MLTTLVRPPSGIERSQRGSIGERTSGTSKRDSRIAHGVSRLPPHSTLPSDPAPPCPILNDPAIRPPLCISLTLSIPMEDLASNGESVRGKVLHITCALCTQGPMDEVGQQVFKDWWEMVSPLLPLPHTKHYFIFIFVCVFF